VKLIRVSWNREGTFMVETGELIGHELTEEENAELKMLRNQLEPYGDFLNLGELEEEEREQVFGAKKRRAELEEKGREEMIWVPKPLGEVKSVVLVLQPDTKPIYVENLPPSWIEKLFRSEVIIESPKIFLGGETPPPRSTEGNEGFVEVQGSDKLNRVRKCLYTTEGDPVFRDAETYLDCVNVADEDDRVKVTPKKFLEGDWAPINGALKTAFGDEVKWTTEGKTSHWKILSDNRKKSTH